MRLPTLCTLALLAAGSIGLANATTVNLINNGDFSSTSPTPSGPTQFGSGSGTAGSPSCSWGGQFVSGWTGNGGYGLWYPNAAAASSTSACTQYGNASTQRLPAAVTTPPVGAGTFIGMDGQKGINFGISQDLSGLDPNKQYTVSFYWAVTQEMSRTGPTSDVLQVALGNSALFGAVNACDLTAPAPSSDPGDTYQPFADVYSCDPAPTGFVGQYFQTDGVTIDTHGWSDWMHQSFTFTPNSDSATLSFLSIGTPGGLPPFAVLTGVSMTSVPEPPALAMFGIGLLGLGLLTVFARRRAQRRLAEGDGSELG
ncbi:MAG: hypothetical protein ACREPK_02625 [Rhodanobacteraceae bacterium]